MIKNHQHVIETLNACFSATLQRKWVESHSNFSLSCSLPSYELNAIAHELSPERNDIEAAQQKSTTNKKLNSRQKSAFET